MALRISGLDALSRRGLLTTVALAGVMILSGCGADLPGSQVVPASEDQGVTLEVTRGGVLVDNFPISDIRELPQVTMDANGQKLTGATLRSVLAASGVPEFDRVTISGLRRGRLMSGDVVLTSAQVTGEVLLTINRRGQARFASRDIPSESWIVDVTRVAVE